MDEGYTFYTENDGLPGLRKDLASYYRSVHGVDLDPSSEIVIIASGVQALNVGIRCSFDPGDESLVLTPAWPNGAANSAIPPMSSPIKRPGTKSGNKPRAGLRNPKRNCGSAQASQFQRTHRQHSTRFIENSNHSWKTQSVKSNQGGVMRKYFLERI